MRMTIQAVDRIYSSYSHVYDWGFGFFFRPRVKELIRRLDIKPGERVLELGFGTGCSLAYYPPGVSVYGVDICRAMLAEAEAKRAQRPDLDVHLLEMDATRLAFEDGTFDYVIGAFMCTVVEDPYRLIGEMLRTCKPNGKLALVNHFMSERRPIAWIERLINPLTKRVGWRTDLRVRDLVENTPIRVLETSSLFKIDMFTFVYFDRKPRTTSFPPAAPCHVEVGRAADAALAGHGLATASRG